MKNITETVNEDDSRGYILYQRIKIISVNIGDELKNKLQQIKNLIDKESPDILCLIETHTYYEDFSKIKGWLENKNYKVYYIAESQKEYYKSMKRIKKV